jgi:hypothetical protein
MAPTARSAIALAHVLLCACGAPLCVWCSSVRVQIRNPFDRYSFACILA